MRIFRILPQRSPLNSNFLKYTQAVKPGIASGQIPARQGGYIPHPLDLSHLTGKKIFIRLRGQSLPSSFDLRKENRMTEVKDQGPAGTCWAFATYASLESALLPEQKWDFSENNMKNLLAEACPEGFDRAFDGGGNQYISTAYLARWDGPVREQDRKSVV